MQQRHDSLDQTTTMTLRIERSVRQGIPAYIRSPTDRHSVQAFDRRVSRAEGYGLPAEPHIPLAANILSNIRLPSRDGLTRAFGLVFVSGDRGVEQITEVSDGYKMKKNNQAEGATEAFRYVDC